MRIMLLWATIWALTACSPAYNWRESRPQDSGATLMFPCKPSSHTRKVRLAGTEVRLTLHACSAGDVTWALGVADVGDPAQVATALDELRAAALANLGAQDSTELPLTVVGATPNGRSARLALQGRLPDGSLVQEQVAVFTRGTVVYQATCVGARLPAEAVETFFAGLRTPG